MSVAFPAHTIIRQVCHSHIIPQPGHPGHPGQFVSGHYGIPGVAMQCLPMHVPMVGGEVQMQSQSHMSRMSNYVHNRMHNNVQNPAIYAAHAQPCAPPHNPVLLTSRPVLPPDKWSWIIPGREWKKSRSRVGFKLWRRAWRSCPWYKKRATWFRPSIVESMHISSMRQTFAPKFKQSSSAWKSFEI